MILGVLFNWVPGMQVHYAKVRLQLVFAFQRCFTIWFWDRKTKTASCFDQTCDSRKLLNYTPAAEIQNNIKKKNASNKLIIVTESIAGVGV